MPLFSCIFLLYVHTCMQQPFIILLWTQSPNFRSREPSFQFFLKIRIKEPPSPTISKPSENQVLQAVQLHWGKNSERTNNFLFFNFMKNQGSKSEKMVLSTQKKIGEKLRNLKNCSDNRWGFDGAISNTRPPRDQTLVGLVLVIRK